MWRKSGAFIRRAVVMCFLCRKPCSLHSIRLLNAEALANTAEHAIIEAKRNISDAIAFGLISFIVISIFCGDFKKISCRVMAALSAAALSELLIRKEDTIMRKNFGAKPILYPQPVFIIATYNEDGTANAMNAAWGGISEENEITMCISASHKTTENVLARKAFTVSMATADYVAECDYVGIASGNTVPN